MPANLFSVTEKLCTPDACDGIIDVAMQYPKVEAKTFSKDPDARKSFIRWVPRNHQTEELFAAFETACRKMNADHHGIDVDFAGLKTFQYTEYGPEEHYAAHHMDSRFDGGGRQRKLSFSLLLSDPDNFKGGEFHIGGKNVYLSRGSIIVFPSIIQHSVRPVTEGLRQSLVGWYEGPSWR